MSPSSEANDCSKWENRLIGADAAIGPLAERLRKRADEAAVLREDLGAVVRPPLPTADGHDVEVLATAAGELRGRALKAERIRARVQDLQDVVTADLVGTVERGPLAVLRNTDPLDEHADLVAMASKIAERFMMEVEGSSARLTKNRVTLLLRVADEFLSDAMERRRELMRLRARLIRHAQE